MEDVQGEPWTQEDLDSPKFEKLKTIPTNNHLQTLKLLAWSVNSAKPKIIWEFGPWMGYTTALMALAAGPQLKRIFACDNFKWQEWMNRFNAGLSFPLQASFLETFNKYTEEFKDVVKGLEWNSDLAQLPKELKEEGEEKPDFVFVDFTRESEGLENLWKDLQPNLTVCSTILVFNYVWEGTAEFFKNHEKELKPIAKYGVACAYLYV